MSLLVAWFYIGGFAVAWKHHRKSQGRIGSFIDASLWPLEAGRKIAEHIYRA